MYRKIVWCYFTVLTLLDISLNTKLSAQGKSHGNGVSVHESLIEDISLQEWGKEGGAESGAGRGRAAPPDAVALSPAALRFGPRALAAPHALAVTLTNTANETLHLASLSGVTPDFYASFFESKTLPPQTNTTFSVVYLGRREGPVSAHLYIHTSKGVIKYSVSAVGVASAWRVWPLLGVRVPLNASLEPLLTLYNPTDATVQVSEVYSSAAWLGLRLPGGGDAAPRELWALPPHAARPLVRLRLRPPHPPADTNVAYIRIKTEGGGGGGGEGGGGALVVCVEASGAAAGEFVLPLQLRLTTRGSEDPPDTFTISAGNSGDSGVKLDAELWGAQCGAAPPDPAPPPPPHARPAANGARWPAGARVALLRERLDAHHDPTPAADLTLDYGALWAGAGGAQDAWCAGWVRVGRAAAPYSVRVLRGTLALHPKELHFVTANAEQAYKTQEVLVTNQFPEPVRLLRVDFPPEVEELFHTESLAPLELGAGARGAAARLRLRAGAEHAPASLRAELTLRTNLSDYSLPVLLYEGRLHIEWEWGAGADADADAEGALALGAVGASSTRRVWARLHNRGAAPLCIVRLQALLPGATLDADTQRCVPAGGHARAVLTVVAPAREGAHAGAVCVTTQHAATTVPLTLSVHAGRLHLPPLLLDAAAPYVWARAPLVVESTMSLRMRVTHVTQPPDRNDPALRYLLPEKESEREISEGRNIVGHIEYAAEVLCEPNCATGLDTDSPEGAAWVARAWAGGGALAADTALWRARLARFPRAAGNVSLWLHSTQVRGAPAAGALRWAWPALVAAPPAAPLAAVGAPAALRLRLRNPAARPLALHALLAPDPQHPPTAAFAVGPWRALAGAAAAWRERYVVLGAGAELELTVTFTPPSADHSAALLYLRNNLTILESVPLSGRGAHPSFEVAGLAPNSTAALVVEAADCGEASRTLLVRNTGAVALRLRDWRLAGEPCAARGFQLRPCGILTLQPNETRALTLAYTADWTRARADLPLAVSVGPAAASFRLEAAVPARLIARCAPRAPRPPFEPALRTLGDVLALVALAAVVALAAADAERALRRHRAARDAAPPPRAPLDLRALARADPPPPPPERAPAPRRRRPPPARRARPAALEAAERRAFERWRAEVSRREESRSSEEGGPAGAEGAPPPGAGPCGDADSSSAESSAGGRGRTSGSSACSSAGSEREEPEEGAAAPPARPRARAAPPAGPHAPAPHDETQECSSRHESSSPRAERAAGGGGEARPRTRSGSARAGARKERAARRRERAASPPPPPRHEGRAPPAVRWGASWSSVVAARAARHAAARADRGAAGRARAGAGGRARARPLADGRRGRRAAAAGADRVGRAAARRVALAVLLRRGAGAGAPRAGLPVAAAGRRRDAVRRRADAAAPRLPRGGGERERLRGAGGRRGRGRRVPLAGVRVGRVHGAAPRGRRVAVGRRRRRGAAAPARLPRPARLRPLPLARVDLDAGGAGLAAPHRLAARRRAAARRRRGRAAAAAAAAARRRLAARRRSPLRVLRVRLARPRSERTVGGAGRRGKDVIVLKPSLRSLVDLVGSSRAAGPRARRAGALVMSLLRAPLPLYLVGTVRRRPLARQI